MMVRTGSVTGTLPQPTYNRIAPTWGERGACRFLPIQGLQRLHQDVERQLIQLDGGADAGFVVLRREDGAFQKAIVFQNCAP